MPNRFNLRLLASTFAVSALLITSTAFAHVKPEQLSPAPNSEGAAPESVRITFSGQIEPAFSSLRVTDAAGRSVDAGNSQVDQTDRKTLTVGLSALGAGRYVAHWTIVATDGHRVEGEYPFIVKE